jgi:hypothetical protein
MLSPIRLLRLPSSSEKEQELLLKILTIDDVFNDIERKRRNDIEKAAHPKINYVQVPNTDKVHVNEKIKFIELNEQENIAKNEMKVLTNQDTIDNVNENKIDVIDQPYVDDIIATHNESNKQPLIPLMMKLQYKTRNELLNSLYQYISLRKRYFYKSNTKNDITASNSNNNNHNNNSINEEIDWNKDVEINQLQNLIDLSTFRKNIMTKIEYNTQKDYILEDNDYINA